MSLDLHIAGNECHVWGYTLHVYTTTCTTTSANSPNIDSEIHGKYGGHNASYFAYDKGVYLIGRTEGQTLNELVFIIEVLIK